MRYTILLETETSHVPDFERAALWREANELAFRLKSIGREITNIEQLDKDSICINIELTEG